MHSIAEIGTNVPAFIGKLWKMVEDPVSNDLIGWSMSGTSFVIKDEIRFSRELLPMYYKHNNMASFIRQLNMYGFHKIVSPEAGSMKMENNEEIMFTHPFFMRGHPYLLENIKRKIGVSKALPVQLGEKAPQVINKVLTDVRQMKGRQESMDSRLTAMKLENGALWRELSVLRQKHIKQQQIVNKLIQFLVTIVQQNHNSFSVNRKFPRMLQHHIRSPKNHHDDGKEDDKSSTHSPLGPIIHELDPAEALLETVVEEAESVSPTNDTDYFLNQTSENLEETVVDMEIPQSFMIYTEDPNAETIIGLPEDSSLEDRLMLSRAKGQQQQNLLSYNGNSKSNILSLPKRPRIEDSSRLKFIRTSMKKPQKSNGVIQQIEQNQSSILNTQYGKNRQKKMRIKHLPPINTQQIKGNKLNFDKNHLQKNLVLQLKNQQPPSQKNQQLKTNQQLQSNYQQQLMKGKQLLPKNQTQPFLNIDPVECSQSNQQELLLQGFPQQVQPSSEPVITSPFDSGTNGVVTTEVDTSEIEPLYVDNGALNIPVIVDSPVVCSPQNVLVQSPAMDNEPALTPLSDNVQITSAKPSPNTNNEMQVACVDESKVTSPSQISRSALRSSNELDNHIENVQSDLDNLKELLRSEGISLDANTLLGYFNDDPLSFNISDHVGGDDPKENNGNELMTYNPSLFDLTDLIGNEWSLPPSPGDVPIDDTFSQVNTPQFVPQSPSFPTPAKKRKK